MEQGLQIATRAAPVVVWAFTITYPNCMKYEDLVSVLVILQGILSVMHGIVGSVLQYHSQVLSVQ
jgi:hypothetical protein